MARSAMPSGPSSTSTRRATRRMSAVVSARARSRRLTWALLVSLDTVNSVCEVHAVHHSKRCKQRERPMQTPPIATREEWLDARLGLLEQEKQLNRDRDAVSAARRQLPMMRIETPYEFDGPDGPTSLLDLFADRRQLIVYHFMFEPGWDEGCPSCSYLADNATGAIRHLEARDTAFAMVSRAPFTAIDAFRRRMGWPFTWVSSFETDFNYD